MLSYENALTRAQTAISSNRFYIRDWNALEDEIATYPHDYAMSLMAQAMTEHRHNRINGAMALVAMIAFITNPENK